ncbi:MAG: NapC/NirT family cytochrome c [Deltaproteobacteria bacterium]|nr:NapC/NirT family cytochrome c [Deltaproteobacteria bacterium]
MPDEPKHTGLYRNAVSFFGALVSIGSILLIIFAIALDLSLKRPSPYIGIFTYMVFPAFFTVGAVLFLYGMRRESIRRRKAGTVEALPYPRLDLNEPVQRKWFSYFVLGGTLLAILITFVTYNAFLFTESVSFCGTLCHSVMKPEYEAYEASPHARVSCVDCHVGRGASWYVKSKLSGARQVIAVLFHSYPTPIPTPIENLRPARETCEECHWPAKFFGTQLMQIPHFRYDERNTPEQISLGVKTGGGSEVLGGTAGIHWHMIIENKVRYVAVDRQKQEIPWIEVRHADGRVDEYTSLDFKGTKEQLASLPKDDMDCMDCHNRPTHIFLPPETAVDRAMTTGLIPRTLPWVKKVVVDALVRDYPSRGKAHEGLRAEISRFYKERYPAVFKAREADVENAIANAVSIYDRSVFPKMKVNWKTYPSNIGHRNWPGCFRCHDGRHTSKEGKILSMECTVCHTHPLRSPLMPLGTVMAASRMPWHPIELAGKHGRILCSRCHSAGYRPPTDCAECHKLDASAPMMSSVTCGDCHRKAGEARPVTDCKECHDRLSGLHRRGGHPDAACTDCHKPHAWAVTGRDLCLECHSDMKEHHAAQGACAKCHDFRERKT